MHTFVKHGSIVFYRINTTTDVIQEFPACGLWIPASEGLTVGP